MRTEHLIQSIKAAVIGTLLSVVFALLLAVVVHFFPMRDGARLVVAQSLKALSLLMGCMLSLKTEGGWKKGMLTGVLFTMLTYLSFSGIGGFSWSWGILLDLALGVSVGALSGIAAVNLRRSV
jgi:putative membrane protein (TIGR04086 family)